MTVGFFGKFPGRDGLGNAAAFGALEVSPGEGGADDEAERGDYDGEQPESGADVLERALGEVGSLGEGHADASHSDGAAPENQALAPEG